jgi:cob(I)alamin adenosyltransferase
MKIYTRTGDEGTTGLFGGQRAPKNDPRFDCIGTLDELNAAIGWSAASAPTLSATLHQIQNELFIIGSQLASPKPSPSLPTLSATSITRLEQEIDGAEKDLEPLRQFILPGGSESAARLHLTRAIARRAERHLVAFIAQNPLDPTILQFINRLSDWLFVQARWLNKQQNIADIPWQK